MEDPEHQLAAAFEFLNMNQDEFFKIDPELARRQLQAHLLSLEIEVRHRLYSGDIKARRIAQEVFEDFIQILNAMRDLILNALAVQGQSIPHFNADPSEHFTWAFKHLNIDPERFARTSNFRELNQRHLQARYASEELSLIQKEAEFEISSEEAKLKLSYLDSAYAIVYSVLTTPEIAVSAYTPKSDYRYNKDSWGLTELEWYAAPPIDTVGREAKNEGVEPGFIATTIDDISLAVFISYPDKDKRRSYLRAQAGNIEALYEDLKTTVSKYLFKLDCKASFVWGNLIIPDLSAIKRTSAIRKLNEQQGDTVGLVGAIIFWLSKVSSFTTKNLEAVLENLANDLARAYGMEVQKQSLVRTKYENNGLLKLMLKAELFKDFTTLKLAGNLPQTDGNYLVKEVSARSGVYLSDDSIKNLAEYLFLFAVLLSDYDAFGSKGSNKLKSKNQLLGIDFGGAFRKEAINYIGNNLHVQHPDFKNYSVFYDRPRREMIRGLIKLAIISGRKLSRTVCESYGEDFYQETESLVPGMFKQIFNDYIYKFQELALEFTGIDLVSKDNRYCCEVIIQTLEQVRAEAMARIEKLLDKFKLYLSLEARLVDLCENFEKAFAGKEGCSLKSQDEKVLLNYLRLKKPLNITWSVASKLNRGTNAWYYIISAQFRGNRGARAKRCNTAQQNLEVIKASFEEQSFELTISKKTSKISLIFACDALDAACACFNEARLQGIYAKETLELREQFKASLSSSESHSIIVAPRHLDVEAGGGLAEKNCLQFDEQEAPSIAEIREATEFDAEIEVETLGEHRSKANSSLEGEIDISQSTTADLIENSTVFEAVLATLYSCCVSILHFFVSGQVSLPTAAEAPQKQHAGVFYSPLLINGGLIPQPLLSRSIA